MVIAGQPVGEVQDQAGQEPCLGQAQQEAQHGEAGGAGDEGGGGGEQAPGDHDPGDPQAGADFLHDDVAGNLEDEVAPEEDAGGEAEVRRTHVQVATHGQGGEAHVDAIDVG